MKMENRTINLIIIIIVGLIFIIVTAMVLTFSSNSSTSSSIGFNDFLSSIGLGQKSAKTITVVMPKEGSANTQASIQQTTTQNQNSDGNIRLFYVSGQSPANSQSPMMISTPTNTNNNYQVQYANTQQYSTQTTNYNPPATANHYININNFAFYPATLTIMQGESVAWTNNDAVSHTVTTYHVYELDSPTLSPGDTYIHTFDTPGTYYYQCSIHPFMKATIIVENNQNQQNYQGNYNQNNVYYDNSNQYASNNHRNSQNIQNQPYVYDSEAANNNQNTNSQALNENRVYVFVPRQQNNNNNNNNNQMQGMDTSLQPISSDNLPGSNYNIHSDAFSLPISPIDIFVDISNFAFYPSSKIIEQGDTVTWTNNDGVAHTITSDSGSELNSGMLQPGDSYWHTFNTPGNYYYHCSIHNSMRGLIIVSNKQLLAGHVQFLGNQQAAFRAAP